MLQNSNAKTRRAMRTRKHIRGTSEMPRLTVFRSNRHMYAQIIDDLQKQTMLGLSEKTIATAGTKIEKAHALGQELAKLAAAKKIKKVVFDKGSYAYHGRVKAIAEGAREGGLTF